MHEIGIDVGSIEVGTSPHCAENRAQRFRASEIARVNLVAGDLEIAFFKALIAKATNFHRHRLCEFARKKADVNACAAVNVRWIFVGQKQNFHEGPNSL
jgi:hypothetical protein